MTIKRVAFPGTQKGVESNLSLHFGHTDAFVILEYDNETKEQKDVETIKNPPHSQGGCMMPVMLLKDANVDEVVLGGIGGRPLMGFQQVGIETYRGIEGSIKENFEQFVQSGLPKLTMPSCNSHKH